MKRDDIRDPVAFRRGSRTASAAQCGQDCRFILWLDEDLTTARFEHGPLGGPADYVASIPIGPLTSDENVAGSLSGTLLHLIESAHSGELVSDRLGGGA